MIGNGIKTRHYYKATFQTRLMCTVGFLYFDTDTFCYTCLGSFIRQNIIKWWHILVDLIHACLCELLAFKATLLNILWTFYNNKKYAFCVSTLFQSTRNRQIYIIQVFDEIVWWTWQIYGLKFILEHFIQTIRWCVHQSQYIFGLQCPRKTISHGMNTFHDIHLGVNMTFIYKKY